jgi:hypothetical protein
VPVVTVSNPNLSALDIAISLNLSSGFIPNKSAANYLKYPYGFGAQHLISIL